MTHADAHTPLAWQTDAACTTSDPDRWFPEAGRGDAAVKTICNTICAVREQCLQYALENREEFGTWGGMSAHERRLLLAGTEGRRT
jgi:WhiB family redox-sensing transcriptional regulator